MLKFIIGVFMVLHGLVHLLYFGQSWRLFELQPGMVWPDGSWLFSRLLGDESTRWLASISCILAAIGFVAGGIGIFAGQVWWRPVVTGSAAFSAAIYILFWDGKCRNWPTRAGLPCLSTSRFWWPCSFCGGPLLSSRPSHFSQHLGVTHFDLPKAGHSKIRYAS